jgi:hypothetical protein
MGAASGEKFHDPWTRCRRCGTLRPTEFLKWHGTDDGWRCVEPGFCSKAKAELDARVAAVRGEP